MSRNQPQNDLARERRVDSDAIGWWDYPRIAPGEYLAYCRWGKQYRDPGFRRWLCLLRWDVMTEDLTRVIASVPLWLPLGAGDKPHATRRGNISLSGYEPTGGHQYADRLSPIQRLACVEIGDTEGPASYSAVRKIVEWETGS